MSYYLVWTNRRKGDFKSEESYSLILEKVKEMKNLDLCGFEIEEKIGELLKNKEISFRIVKVDYECPKIWKKEIVEKFYELCSTDLFCKWMKEQGFEEIYDKNQERRFVKDLKIEDENLIEELASYLNSSWDFNVETIDLVKVD